MEEQIDLFTYKAVCHIVSIYTHNRKRLDEKIKEITDLCSRPDFFVQGGERISKQELAVSMREKLDKSPLAQMVYGVEIAMNGVRAMHDGMDYAGRLAEALKESCSNPFKYNYVYANEFYKLFMTERTFYRWKRSFVFDIAQYLGLVGENEMFTEFEKMAGT